MASRIKGITVEIGGDTTKLEQSLKSVNSTIKSTQSQLKDVTKLLKLDPKNTELLSQKQRLLKDAVHKLGTKIPPLVNSYINISSTMKMLGSCINDELGDAIETGIMICYDELYDDKKDRHMEAFVKNKLKTIRKKYPHTTEVAMAKLREQIAKKRLRALQKFQKQIKLKQSPDIEFH